MDISKLAYFRVYEIRTSPVFGLVSFDLQTARQLVSDTGRRFVAVTARLTATNVPLILQPVCPG